MLRIVLGFGIKVSGCLVIFLVGDEEGERGGEGFYSIGWGWRCIVGG